jgi:hypothetical protein
LLRLRLEACGEQGAMSVHPSIIIGSDHYPVKVKFQVTRISPPKYERPTIVL